MEVDMHIHRAVHFMAFFTTFFTSTSYRCMIYAHPSILTTADSKRYLLASVHPQSLGETWFGEAIYEKFEIATALLRCWISAPVLILILLSKWRKILDCVFTRTWLCSNLNNLNLKWKWFFFFLEQISRFKDKKVFVGNFVFYCALYLKKFVILWNGDLKWPSWNFEIYYCDFWICNIYNFGNRDILQSFSEMMETTAKNGVIPLAISNVKLF